MDKFKITIDLPLPTKTFCKTVYLDFGGFFRIYLFMVNSHGNILNLPKDDALYKVHTFSVAHFTREKKVVSLVDES